MNKEQIINKIMEEYGKHGITKEMAEIVYDMAITMDVPRELIYEGMRYQFNQAIGIEDESAINGVAKGFIEYAVNDDMVNNPMVSKETIKRNIAKEVIHEGIDKIEDSIKDTKGISNDIVKSFMTNLTQFVKENIWFV